jgi:hypothetical protein
MIQVVWCITNFLPKATGPQHQSDCLHKKSAMSLRSSSLETASHTASGTCFCLWTMKCAQWLWMSGTSWQKHSISVVSHLPYPPHLALCELLLLPKLMITLNGKTFQDIPQIQMNTTCRCWPFQKVLPQIHWKVEESLESLHTIWSILLPRKKLNSNLKVLKFSSNKLCPGYLWSTHICHWPHAELNLTHKNTQTKMFMSTHSPNNMYKKTRNVHIT